MKDLKALMFLPMPAKPTYSIAYLCKAVERKQLYVQNIQRSLGLSVRNDDRYTFGYISFMRKVMALLTVGVQQEKITELLELEKKILILLNIHTLTSSDTWYLDANCPPSDRTLLLTGFKVDFPLDGSVQPSLDFGGGEQEMFAGHEMGEDLMHILKTYTERKDRLLERATKKIPMIRKSLKLVSALIRATQS